MELCRGERRPDRAPGAVRVHRHPQARGDADPRADLVAEDQRGDQVGTRGSRLLRGGEGRGHDVDAGMAAGVLVALVQFQRRAGSTVDQSRVARIEGQAAADRRRRAGAAVGKALGERPAFRFAHPGGDDAERVEEDQAGTVERRLRNVGGDETGRKGGPLPEPGGDGLGQQRGRRDDAGGDDAHLTAPDRCGAGPGRRPKSPHRLRARRYRSPGCRRGSRDRATAPRSAPPA